MSVKRNIKSSYSILPIFGFILVLILSPCKVRNFIQATLDIPETEVTNKNQTTIGNSNCSTFQVLVNNSNQKKQNTQQLPEITSNADVTFSVNSFYTNNLQSYKVRINSISSIPLYILYQNFKDYL